MFTFHFLYTTLSLAFFFLDKKINCILLLPRIELGTFSVNIIPSLYVVYILRLSSALNL